MSMDFKGVTYQSIEPLDETLMERLPEDLQDFYRVCNGLIAFNGGLHIRSCVQGDTWISLGRYWTGEKALHKVYPNLLTSDIPFAQDCVGDQFFMRDDTVWLLSTETGEVMDMEVELDEFLEISIEDPVEYLAMEPLVHHLDSEGALELGHLVHVVPGLSLDLGDDTAYHIDSLPVDKRLDWLKDFFNEHREKA
jgi:hypothetical protein